MTKQAIIEKTIRIINRLPEEKAEEISDFADFLAKQYEEERMTAGLQELAAKGKAFDFLAEEEEIYSVKDLKEKY